MFKPTGHDEECYHIGSLVNGIMNLPIPTSIVDTEDSYHHFWGTIIEEPLKFFFDGNIIGEWNKAGERDIIGKRLDKVIRFGL